MGHVQSLQGGGKGDKHYMQLANKSVEGRPEDELILCCAQRRRGKDQSDRMRSLLQKEIDWFYLKRRALWHGLLPLLYLGIRDTCSEAIPEDLLNRLKECYVLSSRRSLFLTGELVRLLRLLETSGIPVIPYKGPALAAMAYRDLTVREFDDLDLLVHKEDVPRAKELLIAQGYRPFFSLNEVQEDAYLESPFEYSRAFLREDGIGFVDLHWAVEPEYLSFAFCNKHLWERVEGVNVGGFTVKTFAPEDMLLFLCLHGTKHRWERLIWLCDLAELIQAHHEIDWQKLLERAEDLGMKRMISLSLRLAKDFLIRLFLKR